MINSTVSTIIGQNLIPGNTIRTTASIEYTTAKNQFGEKFLVKTARVDSEQGKQTYSRQGRKTILHEMDCLEHAEGIEGVPTMHIGLDGKPPILVLSDVYGHFLTEVRDVTQTESIRVHDLVKRLHQRGIFGLDLQGIALVQEKETDDRTPYVLEGWNNIKKIPAGSLRDRFNRNLRSRLIQKDLNCLDLALRHRVMSSQDEQADGPTVVGYPENLTTALTHS